MKLILTEAEKKAATWLELDDDSVGKFVKANATHFYNKATEGEKIFLMAAAMALCSAAAKANADTLKQTIEGLTVKGKPFGNWIVTIQKVLASDALSGRE